MLRLKTFRRRAYRVAVFFAVVAVFLSGIPAPALADVFTWTNNGDGAFSNAANWQGNNAPPGTPPDVLVFGGALPYTAVNDVAANLSLSELQFTGTGSYLSVITGSSFLFDASGNGLITQGGSGPFQVTNALVLGRDITVSGGGSGTIALSGGISGASFGITKGGNFTLNLLGANTFGGGVTLAGGTLRVTADNNFGAAPGAPTVNLRVTQNGGTLQSAGNFSLNANRTIDLQSNLTVNPSANTTLTILGLIQGSGGLVKDGVNTLTLQGSNTFSGGITILGGALTMSSASAAGSVTMTTPGSGDINLAFGALNLRARGTANNGFVDVGTTGGVDLRMLGSATVDVRQSSTTTGIRMRFADLLMGANTLTTTGANAYRVYIAGTTTIGAGNTQFAPSSLTDGILELAGPIVTADATFGITKVGAGLLVISGNQANTFTGPTNLLAGQMLVDTNSSLAAGTPLGTGHVNVMPTGILRLTTADDLGFTLNVYSSAFAAGAVATDNATLLDLVNSPIVSDTNAMQAVYGSGLRFTAATGGADIDLGLFGRGDNIYFGANGAQTYSGQLVNSFDGIVRLANDTAATVLTLTASSGLFSASQVWFGNPTSQVGAMTGGSGTFVLSSTNTMGPTTTDTIWRFSTVRVQSNPLGFNDGPFGRSAIEVFGTLTLEGLLGSLTISGVGTVTDGVDPIANYNLVLRPGGVLRLDNTTGLVTQTTVGHLEGRLSDSFGFNLNGATFQVTGNTTTSVFETVGTINLSKGGTINVIQGTNTTTGSVELTVQSFTRSPLGTLTLLPTTTGQLSLRESVRVSDSTGLITGGLNGGAGSMAPAWIVNQDISNQSFVTLNGSNSFTNAAYSGTLAAGTPTSIVDVSAATALTAAANVYALRARHNISGSSVTISGTSGHGSGLLVTGTNLTISSALNFTEEATVFVGNLTNSTTINTGTISGAITSANGLVKFGPGSLVLSGTNTGLTGGIAVNSGLLQFASVAAANGQDIVMNGGNLNFSVNPARWTSDVIVAADGTLSGNLASLPSLAFGTGSGDPTFITFTNGTTMYVREAVTLNTNVNWVTAGFATIAGQVSDLGSGYAINKWGNNFLFLDNPTNSYFGGTTVNQGGVLSTHLTSGTPFGSGTITINPAGGMRFSTTDIAAANGVTVRSDAAGLGMISVAYNGPLPTVTWEKLGSSAPYDGFVGIDVVGYSSALDQATLTPDGMGFLMTSSNGIITGNISAGVGNMFRLGGAVAGGSNTLFVHTALTGSANGLIIGALSNGDASYQSNSLLLNNGQTGTVELNVANTFGGNTRISGNGTTQQAVTIGNNAAFSTGTVFFNGGTINSDETGIPLLLSRRQITNTGIMLGDIVFGGANSLDWAGDILLQRTTVTAPGGMNTINVASTTGIFEISGDISDGGGANQNLVKLGVGTLELSGTNNTYSGYTLVQQGNLLISSQANLSQNSTLILAQVNATNVGTLAYWTSSPMTLTSNITTSGAGIIDVGPGGILRLEGIVGGNGVMQKNGAGILELAGENTNQQWQINAGAIRTDSLLRLGDPLTNATVTFNNGELRIAPPSNVTTQTNTRSFTVNNGTFGMLSMNDGLQVINVNANIITTTSGTFIVNGGELLLSGATSTQGVVTGTAPTVVVGGGGTLATNNTVNNLFALTSNVNGTLQVQGGTVRLDATGTGAVNQLAGRLALNGGAVFVLNSGTTVNDAAITFTNATSMNRSNNGTLVIVANNTNTSLIGGEVYSSLGAATGGAADGRLLIRAGAGALTTNVNGMVAPYALRHLSGTDSAANFVSYNATNGFTNHTGNLVASANVVSLTSIADIAAADVISTVDAEVWAVRTRADISGGSLRIGSGGLIINGANTISSNLTFFSSSTNLANPGNGLVVGEGFVYVSGTGTAANPAILSGDLFGTGLTKFGEGDLQILSDDMAFTGTITVNKGTLRFGSGSINTRLATVVINDGAMLDLRDGGTLRLGNLSSGAGNSGTGRIGSTLLGQGGVVRILSLTNSTFAGFISDDIRLVKDGIGALTLSGGNSFTGGVELVGGQITALGAQSLGGRAAFIGGPLTSPGVVTLRNGTLAMNTVDGAQIKGTNTWGGASALAIDIRGNVTISVDRNGSGNFITQQIGNLSIGNHTLNVTGSTTTNYRFEAAGNITLLGPAARFNAASTAPASNIVLSGIISGTGALNAASAGSRNGVTISGTANTYSGGTNVLGQALQITSNTGTPVGTGRVIVNPATFLRIAGPNSLGGAPLEILSNQTQFGALVLDADFDPATIPGLNAAGVFDSVYGGTVQVMGPNFTTNINQAAIGSGRLFFGNYQTLDVQSTMMGAGLLDAPNTPAPLALSGVDGIYRLGGSNGGQMNLSGPDNLLTGTNLVIFGATRSTIAAVTNGNGTTVIRNSNNYSGGTMINEGSTVQLETGGSAVGSTPLGTGKIEVLGTLSLIGTAGSLASGNTGTNTNVLSLRPGSVLQFDNGTVFGSQSSQGRFGDNQALNLNGALLRMLGNGNQNVTETIGVVTANKFATLRVDRGSTAMSTELILSGLARGPRGQVAVLLANGDQTNEFVSVIGGATSITGGLTSGLSGGLSMLQPWIIYSQNNQFATLSGTNIVNAGFSLTTSNLATANASHIVDFINTQTLGANATMFALRISGTNINGFGRNITITGDGEVSGLITLTNSVIQPNIIAPGELAVFTFTGTTQLLGDITTTGLTKGGAGTLNLRTPNAGITGDIVVNQGNLQLDTRGAAGSQDITLNGGALLLQNFLNQTATALQNGVNTLNIIGYRPGTISVINDASITNNNQVIQQGITDLFIHNRGSNVAPPVVLLNGIRVAGTTTLAGNVMLNIGASGTVWTVLEGQATGTGAISKFGTGRLVLANSTNNYSGDTIVNAGLLQAGASSGTPLGTGNVYVNPNGNLSIIAATSLTNAVTVYSERAGLGGFGISYNTTTLPGNVTYQTTGPFDGALNIDSRLFTSSLDMSTLGPNGRLFLGSAIDGIYAAQSLGANNGNQYLLGAGATTLNMSWYEGQLSGANTVQIGAISNGAQFASISMSNTGSVTLDSRNPLLTGDVYINAGALLNSRHGGAFGTGDIVFNGGTLTQNQLIYNNVRMLGDVTLSNDITFMGNWNLLPQAGDIGGATRIINVNTNNVAINGIVSGVDSNLIKGGTGILVLNGPNTFNGVVTLSNGTLIVGGDVIGGQAGPLGNATSALLMGDPLSGNNSQVLQLPGRVEFARSIMMVASGTGTRTVRNQSIRRADITGNIAVAQASIFESQTGGRLQILGSINGVNQNITFGTSITNGANGQIRLAAVVNGYNISDYTGTTFINDARVIVAGKTLYTGPADAPTAIISGAFGASTIRFNGTQTNSAAISGISAEGEAALIVNPIEFGSTTANIAFRGLNSIEFTRDLNLLLVTSTNTSVSRIFNVALDPERGESILFSGDITDTTAGTAIGTLIKQGPGTLVLTGSNSFRGGLRIDAGTVAVDDDFALGALTGTVALAGGTLRFTNSTNINAGRLISVTSGAAVSSIQVDGGQTVVYDGGFGITGTAALPTLVKLGAGTLRVDSTNNQIGVFQIGGFNPASGLVNGVGGGSGTVEVGAATGPILVNSTNTNSAVVINGGRLFISGAVSGTADVNVPRLVVGLSATQYGSSVLQFGANTNLTLSNTTTTALVRNGQGTLLLQPTALANLGITENLTLTAGMIGQPLTTVVNGMLDVPFIMARTNVTDANFVTITGTNTFALNTATTIGDLNAASATDLGNVLTANTLTQDASVFALRAQANIDGPFAISIGNGGLILNGNSAVTISSDINFGTSSTALREAIVFVDLNGATLAGNLRATNFTKLGDGTLTISGTNNQLDQSATLGIPNIAVNDGILRFASAASVPVLAGIMDRPVMVTVQGQGALDLNGQNITIGGLVGTGRVINSGAAGTLTVRQNNSTFLFDGSISETGNAISLVKRGSGVLILNGISDYSGGTTINAGRIDNAGMGASTGGLDLRTREAAGNGPITLAGGILFLKAEVANANIQELGFDVNTFGPDAGYNVTVTNALVNGVEYRTSQINADRISAGTGGVLRINDLDMQSDFLTVSGANTYRLQVNGTTTFHADTTLNVLGGGTLMLDGTMTGTIGDLTKVGNGTLLLANGDNYSTVPFENVFVRGGILETRGDPGVSDPLAGAKVILSDAQWTLRNDGDSTQSVQRNTMANILVFGSDTGEKIAGNGTLNVDRVVTNGVGGSASNKNFVFDEMRMGGGLGAPLVSINGGNGFTVVAENVALYSQISLSSSVGFTMKNVTDGGRGYYIERISGNSLFAGNNTFSGGFFNRSGTLMFGVQEGGGSLAAGNITLDNNATAGTGRVTIGVGARIRFNAASNVAAGQQVQVYSNLANLGAFGIAGAVEAASSDTSLEHYGFRAYGRGVLSINGQYSQALDMRALGSGLFYLGSAGNGVQIQNANGVYTGTLTAGAGNVFRLGGDGSTLWIRNATLGDDYRGSASVVVGEGLTNGSGANPGLGTGTVILDGGNYQYTGETLVNRGSTLRVRGALQSSSLTSFGTVILEGPDGTLAGSPTTLDLRPGSLLQLNNDSASFVTDTRGRLADNLTVRLNTATLQLFGAIPVDTTETIGAVSFTGASELLMQTAQTGRYAQLALSGTTAFIRDGQATLQITSANGGRLGSDERLVLTNSNALGNIFHLGVTGTGIVNGMLAPWLINRVDLRYVTYVDPANGGTGFASAEFDRTLSGNLGTLNLDTEKVLFNAATTLTGNNVVTVFAARIDNNLSGTGSSALVVRSGGILSNAASTITTALQFNDGTQDIEAIVYNVNNFILGTTVGAADGQVTSNGLFTKSGPGNIIFHATQADQITNLQVNAGGAAIRTANALGPGLATVTLAGVSSTAFFQADAATTFNAGVVLARDVITANINTDRINTTGATPNHVINFLTFQGVAGSTPQQLFVLTNSGGTLNVTNTTTLSAGSHLINTNGANLSLNGKVTGGGGTLIKTGGNTLFLTNNLTGADANDFTGGIQLNAGVLEARFGTALDGSITSDVLNGNIVTLYGGQYNLRANGSATSTQFIALPNAVTVVGNATIDVNRFAGSGTSKTLNLSSVTIGNAILTTTGGNSYAFSTTDLHLRGTALLSPGGAAMTIRGSVTGTGFGIIKNNTGTLLLATNNLQITEGIVVNRGALDLTLGGANVLSANIGKVRINPGAQVLLRTNTINGELNAGQLQVYTSGAGMGMVRLVGTNQNPASIISADSEGVVAMNANPAATMVFDLNAWGNGQFYLGASGGQTYAAATLGASSVNVLAGKGAVTTSGFSRIYRLGGGGSTLTLNSATLASPLAGDSAIVIGSMLVNGAGSVVLNDLLPESVTSEISIIRGSGLFVTSANVANATPLGTGQVEVYGTLEYRTLATAYNSAGTGMANDINLHPGAVLIFNNNVTNSSNDRWLDSQGIVLDGAELQFTSINNLGNSETVGSLAFNRNANVRIANVGTGTTQLSISSLNRSGAGSTLSIFTGDAGSLGSAAATNADRLVVSNTVGGPAVVNGMLPGYIVNATDNLFVTYSATNSLVNAAFTATSSGSTFTAGITAGTDIVHVTAAATLDYNPSLYAMKLLTATSGLTGDSGVIPTITFSSGGGDAIGGIITTTNVAMNGVNLQFGASGTGDAYIYTAAGTLTYTGEIIAGSVTKYGAGALTIAKDQTQLNGVDWYINNGTLTLTTLGGAGVGSTIYLNGANQAAGSTLSLSFNTSNTGAMSTADYLWSFAKLVNVDNNTLTWDPLANDRQQRIAAIDLVTTGPADSRLLVNAATGRTRAILNVGTLTVVDPGGSFEQSAILDIRAPGTIGAFNQTGRRNGLAVDSLVGAGQSLTKWGGGYLYLNNDNAATWTGGEINVDLGAVWVGHAQALGNATSTFNARRYGVLDIGVADFFAGNDATLNFADESVLRLSADLTTIGAVDLGGAYLQVNADQHGTGTFTMHGGGIEGFLMQDENIQAINRTLGENIDFVLAADGFVGQNRTASDYGLDSGQNYVNNTGANATAPFGYSFMNTTLDIRGEISGTGGLTKRGFDLVILSGANSYSGGTTVLEGILAIGRDNALAVGGALTTRGGNPFVNNPEVNGYVTGVFDLNGFDQMVGALRSGLTQNDGGVLFNSAANLSTFTVNQNVTTTYNGTIVGNIALVKSGTGRLVLTNTNTFTGGVVVSGGTLELAGSLLDSGVTVQNGGTLAGGGAFLGATINSGATHNPGELSVVTQSLLDQDYLLAGTLVIDLFGPVTASVTLGSSGTPGVNNDFLTDIRNLTLTNGSTIRLVGLSGTGTNGVLAGFNRANDYSFLLADFTGTAALGTVGFDTSLFTNFNNIGGGAFALQLSGTGLYLNFTGGGSPGNLIWTGVTSSNWDTTTANWTGSATIYSEFDNVTFNDTATSFFVNLTNSRTPDSVVINNSTAYTFTGVGISGITGGAGLLKQGTGNVTFLNDNTYNGGTTIAGGSITLGNGGTSGSIVGNIVNNGALEINRSDAITLAGIISGTGTLLKLGTGTLTLLGNNVYSGMTTVAAGTLQIGNGGTSGFVTGNITNTGLVVFNRSDAITYTGTIVGSGAVEQRGTGTLVFTGNNTYSGGTTISAGILQIGAGATTGSIVGSVVNNGLLVFNRSNAYTFTGAISGTGSVQKLGASALVFLSDNTYSGTTTISAGTLQLGNNSTAGNVAGNIVNLGSLTLSRSNSFSLAGIISGTGTLVKLGTGTATLLGENTFIGATTVSAGVLEIGDGGTTGSLSSALSLTVAAGTRIQFNRSDASTFGGFIGGPGGLSKEGSGTLTLLGNSTFTGGVTINGGALQLGDGGLVGQFALNLNVTNNGLLIWNRADNLTYTGVTSGTGGVLKLGAGILTFTNANTYSGGTTINGGALQIGGGGTTGSIAGDVVNNGLLIFNRSDNVTFTGLISGTGAVQKLGAGVLTFTVNNTYTGITTIAAGTLALGNGGADGAIASSAIVNNGLLQINRTADLTLTGPISGTGALEKLGNNTVTLVGDNTYTGITTIAAGSLVIGNGGASGGLLSTTIANGGLLQFNRTGSTTTPGVINGIGAVELVAGTVALTGTNTYQGGTTISGGILQVNNDANLGDAAGTLWLSGGSLEPLVDFTLTRTTVLTSATGGFRVGNGITLTSAVALTGVGGLAVTGSGTVWFSNTSTNTYTGDTIVDGGRLILAATLTNAAITGDGISDTSNADIFVTNGGKLYWQNGHQVADTTTIIVDGAGSLAALTSTFFSGTTRVEVLGNVTVTNGGTWTTGRGWTVSYADPIVDGPGSTFSVLGTEDGFLNISNGGTVRIVGDGGSGLGAASFRITSTGAGLNFSGTGGTIRLSSDTTTPNAGRLILNNNVVYNGTVNPAGILNAVQSDIDGNDTGAFGTAAGVVDFDGATRTFTIANGVTDNLTNNVGGFFKTDMQVTASMTNGGLVKNGAGQLLVSNASSLAGGITVNQGLLAVGGPVGSSITLSTGGGLSAGVVTFTSGGAEQAINGIGTLSMGGLNQTWEAGSNLVFQFKGTSLDGTSGAGTDWDVIDFGGGDLTINAGISSQITVYVESFITLTQLGAATGFTDASLVGGNPVNYMWRFATNIDTTSFGSVEAFGNRFVVDDSGVFNSTTGFTRPVTGNGSGSFYVTSVGNDLYIGYQSVPEPGSFLLAGLASLGMAAYGWRRRRKAKAAQTETTESTVVAAQLDPAARPETPEDATI